ncbi:MAG TPA: glycosyltransferase family 39 protein [Verrucomicrobiae bacterium]|jgi:4-amino-4-deoxy-L-arabinose transferase-like glycosyltransferase|nr:glycosyltransferase family 39 protein [Verrucomicrobiae bacterium]
MRAATDRRNAGLAVCLGLLVALVIFVRLRSLPLPLERDEGEYAYAGQLMLDGVPPYKLAYNMKLPGIYAAYAGIMALFGQTPIGIHLGFLLVNLLSLALLSSVARRLTTTSGAAVACVTFGLLAMSPGLFGLQGHATHLVTLLALAGIWAWQRAREKNREFNLFLSGLLFGLSFLCKQPGLFFGFFGGAMTLRDEFRVHPIAWVTAVKRTLLFCLGLTLPFGVACLLLWRGGVFARFWFWTFTYASAHAALLSPPQIISAWQYFYAGIGGVRWWWPLAAIGLVVVITARHANDRRFFLGALLAFSCLAFGGSFWFGQHYFIVMLPVVSLLTAVAVESAAAALPQRTRWPAGAARAAFAVFCLVFIAAQSDVWFRLTPAEVCRKLYARNPFQESVAIGQFLQSHTKPEARIAVFGSEPEIFFYAHRRSATGYIYMYDLVQLQRYAHDMQAEMIRDVEGAKPEYIVLANIVASWMIWPGAEMTAIDWSSQYVDRYYEKAGAVYIYPDHTEYAWSADAMKKTLDTYSVVFLYHRKDSL